MDIIELVNFNSARGVYEKTTDIYEVHKDNKPSFMTISIKVPILGGDTNGDDNISSAELGAMFKNVGRGIEQLVGSAVNALDNITGAPGTEAARANYASGNNDPLDPRSRPSLINNIRSNSLSVSTISGGEISLPMPMEISYDDASNWADDNSAASDLALAGAAQIASFMSSSSSIIGGVLNAVSATAGIDAIKKIGQKSYGIGLEPRKEMYFDGPAFREFTFNWEFSPKSASEADKIKRAVNLLRQHMYPSRISDTAHAIGFEVWKLPSTFVLSFRLGDEENKYLPKLKACVISGITYNPTKEGSWKSFEDGAPMSSTLSITFKEIEVLTQKDIKEGGY